MSESFWRGLMTIFGVVCCVFIHPVIWVAIGAANGTSIAKTFVIAVSTEASLLCFIFICALMARRAHDMEGLCARCKKKLGGRTINGMHPECCVQDILYKHPDRFYSPKSLGRY